MAPAFLELPLQRFRLLSYPRAGSAAGIGLRRPFGGRHHGLALLLWFSGWLLPAAGFAHDLYESWSSATLFADRLELTVTMAASTALRLVDPEGRVKALNADSFPQHRAFFVRAAAGLYVLKAGDRTLAPRQATAELSEENDLVFTLTFPAPPPGLLRFHAAFMIRLGTGYAGILDVGDSTNHQFGWDRLAIESPDLEVRIPAPAPPKR